MRIFLLLIVLFSACSSPVDGLWIEKHNEALLKFSGDSVINNASTGRAKFRYRISGDSISWIGLDPQYNHGKTKRSFWYSLEKDSLRIRYGRKEFEAVYFKVNAETYHDYFFKRGEVTINLPRAENVFPAGWRENLDIKIGFRDKKIVIYIQDIETEIAEVNASIKKIADLIATHPTGSYEYCRMFVDENVPSEYVMWILDHLRVYNFRSITFITKEAHPDEYDRQFFGLKFVIPSVKINLTAVPDSVHLTEEESSIIKKQ